MKLWTLAASVLLCGFASFGQVPVRVNITTDGEGATVFNALRAKIESSSRYKVDSVRVTVLLNVTCLILRPVAGFACSTTVTYYSPVTGGLIETLLRGTIVTGSADYCAEGMFENFVDETRPDKLRKIDENSRVIVSTILAQCSARGGSIPDQTVTCKVRFAN